MDAHQDEVDGRVVYDETAGGPGAHGADPC